MLKKTFEQTAAEIAEYLNHRDYQTGETWHDFCRRNGFTEAEMMSGLGLVERLKSRMP